MVKEMMLCGWTRGFLAACLLAAPGCKAITGGARQDPVEAAREERATQVGSGQGSPEPATSAEVQSLLPKVDVSSEGFGQSGVGPAADMLAEGAMIVALAAAVAGFVRLFQRRLPLLSFLVGMTALLVATVAFFSAAT